MISSSKATFEMMKLVGNMLSFVAVVFGGYTRDMVLHDESASTFFFNTKEKFNQEKKRGFSNGDDMYEDSSIDPDTFLGRMTCPKDIDLFAGNVETVKRYIEYEVVPLLKGTLNLVSSTRGDYSRHPMFSYYFDVTTLTYEYTMPMSSKRIQVGRGKFNLVCPIHRFTVDVVVRKSDHYYCPWEFYSDVAVNMLLMENGTLRTAFDGNDAIDNADLISILTKCIAKGITPMCQMRSVFWNPPRRIEEEAFRESSSAVGIYIPGQLHHDHPSMNFEGKDIYLEGIREYRKKYRLKIISRILKMVLKGWKVHGTGFHPYLVNDMNDTRLNCTGPYYANVRRGI